jgi:hypothetical protein
MELYPLQPSKIQRDALVTNIIRVYRRATSEQLRHGLHWYESARELAEIIGHGDAIQGAGVIAALSANVGWGQNRKMALAMATDGTAKGLPLSLSKAARIMAGESPVAVLGEAPKTQSFFHNIAYPGTSTMVTVDRHAHDIARGERFGNGQRGLSAKGRYAIFVQAYTDAAKIIGIRPSQLQAITWTVWTQTTVPSRYRRT